MQTFRMSLSFVVKAFLLPSMAAFLISGCASTGGPSKVNAAAGCAKEGVIALMEKPNMEKQVNRAATATALLKVSNEMLYRMPVSADAKWIDAVTYENTPEQYQAIMNKLSDDPYFGTVLFTDIQSGNFTTFVSRLSPAEGHLYGLLEKLYTTYPEIYTLSASAESFQQFNGGERKSVEALSSNQYENIEAAVLSLVETNTRKDLESAIKEYKKAFDAATRKEEEIAQLSKDNESKKANAEKIEVAEVELKTLEKTVEEKEEIMDKMWENAIATLDTNVDDKKMQLVRKIKSILTTVDDNAIFAGCTYTTALLKGYQSIDGLKDEMTILGRTAAVATANPKASALMQQRVKRLGTNAIMAIPNIAVGMYMIVKQQLFASKYNGVIKKLIQADDEKQKLLKEQQKSAPAPIQSPEASPAASETPPATEGAEPLQPTPSQTTIQKTKGKKAPVAKTKPAPKTGKNAVMKETPPKPKG